jgi:hypothetical protein
MDYDKLNSIKSELIRIQNATKTGNKNIYDKAGELFKEYENLLSADQQIKY